MKGFKIKNVSFIGRKNANKNNPRKNHLALNNLANHLSFQNIFIDTHLLGNPEK